MLNIDLIRRDPDVLRRSLSRRQEDPAIVDRVVRLDEERRTAITEAGTLRASRNDASKAIGEMMKRGEGEQAEAQKEAVRQVSGRLQELDELLRGLDETSKELMLGLPNIVSDDVPDGPDESGNVVIYEEGERTTHDFALKPHWELSESLGVTRK